VSARAILALRRAAVFLFKMDLAMASAEQSSRARTSARRARGSKIVAAFAFGAPLDAIAEAENIPRKRVEKLLSEELQNMWLAPAQEYARLQIARLEPIYAKLRSRAEKGDLRAVDQILRVLDRLDRYHGFGKAPPPKKPYDENARARLLAKLNLNLQRLPPPAGDKA
jgi:hypothetical protein